MYDYDNLSSQGAGGLNFKLEDRWFTSPKPMIRNIYEFIDKVDDYKNPHFDIITEVVKRKNQLLPCRQCAKKSRFCALLLMFAFKFEMGKVMGFLAIVVTISGRKIFEIFIADPNTQTITSKYFGVRPSILLGHNTDCFLTRCCGANSGLETCFSDLFFLMCLIWYIRHTLKAEKKAGV